MWEVVYFRRLPLRQLPSPASVSPLSATTHLATVVTLPQHNPGVPHLFAPVFLLLASQQPNAGHNQQGLVEWTLPLPRPHLLPLTHRLQTHSLLGSSTALSHLPPPGPIPVTLSP